MSAWWYSDKGTKTGPVEIDELRKLIETGRIGPKTLLWREGMVAWLPLEEVAEMNSFRAAIPPPLPCPSAGRLPRFFARSVDLGWELVLISFLFNPALVPYSPAFFEWLYHTKSYFLFGALSLPAALILDAVVYRALGNTPGKALLRLKVTAPDGNPLNFAQYLKRNFWMWVSGLGLGIPVICQAFMACQFYWLGKGLQASYDESSGNTVVSKPSGRIRKAIVGFAFASFTVVTVVSTGVAYLAHVNAKSSSAKQLYSWENPLTRLSTNINSRWKYSAQSNASDRQVYIFSDQAARAAVILGVEQMPGYAMDAYISIFQKSNAATMSFEGGGRFFERDGHEIWESSGSIVKDKSDRFNVQVTQIGSFFWRIVTVQSMRYNSSDANVEQLRFALWSTVN